MSWDWERVNRWNLLVGQALEDRRQTELEDLTKGECWVKESRLDEQGHHLHSWGWACTGWGRGGGWILKSRKTAGVVVWCGVVGVPAMAAEGAWCWARVRRQRDNMYSFSRSLSSRMSTWRLTAEKTHPVDQNHSFFFKFPLSFYFQHFSNNQTDRMAEERDNQIK